MITLNKKSTIEIIINLFNILFKFLTTNLQSILFSKVYIISVYGNNRKNKKRGSDLGRRRSVHGGSRRGEKTASVGLGFTEGGRGYKNCLYYND